MANDRQLEHWQRTLDGAPALTEAPTDRARPPKVEPTHYANVKQYIPPVLLDTLNKKATHAKLKGFYLATWQVLLSRYSRSEDVVTGVATDKPAGTDVARLIGLECNPVALRTSFADPAVTFESLLPLVEQALAAALENSDVPFTQVVDAVKAPRTQKSAPVFQALLLQHSAPAQKAVTSIGQLDFVLELAEHGGGRQVTLHFNTDLFDKATAHRMLGHYVELLQSAAAAPGTQVARLDLITPPEVTQVLKTFNAWDLPYTELLNPERQTIHGMFEHWAHYTPEAPALTFGDSTLSFAALNARANQLAHRLIELGAAPERPVGILMRRSLDLFTGLVAILKAGSAYVPMDPDYPPDRLAIMAGDSKAPVILSQGDLQEKVAEVLDAVKKEQAAADSSQALPQIVLMDAERDAIAQRPKTSPGVAVKSTNMCYIIFTSGSTGRPKGTVLQHAGVVNYFLSLVDKLKLTPADAFLQKAPISFDASVQELFNAFACGGRVVLAAPGMEKDTQALARLISSQSITNCSCVPSQLEVLLMESELDSCTALRHVLVGGEALPPVLAARFGQRLPNAHLHNAYGPTETTVDATGYDVTAEFKGGASVPIGRPINNMRCYVLDPQLQLLPVGMAGELMVSGIQLAREYLHNPEKTAASFIANPHNHDNNPNHTRMYRTGDLARWLPNGNIEFLGRLDDQVKLRGFRIELGEVEAVLMEAPGVKLAAALVLKDTSGTDRLVGYVSPDAVDKDAIIAELKQRLPAHFVPSLIVPLAEMPLSPAGKVDRKKLKTDKQFTPNWQSAASAGTEEEYEPPSSPLEEKIQKVWHEVLGQEKISVAADFFQIGGNSLRVGMVMAKVRAAIDGDAPTALFFKAPSISGLAREIEALSAAAAQAKPIPAAPYGAEQLSKGIPCWPLQEHLLSQDSDSSQLTAALKFPSPPDAPALEAALKALAARHDLLRTRFTRSDKATLQVLGGELALTQKEVQPGQNFMTALQAEAQIPLDPTQEGGVLRATLLESAPNGKQGAVLALTLHAVAGEEPSMQLLQGQLLTAYESAKSGSAATIAPGLQFRDVLYWLSERQNKGELEAQLAFWRRQLAYAPPLLSLPLDYPRQASDEAGEARSVPLVLPAGLVTQLNNVATASGVSPFMALLAVWQLLLSCYSQTEDIIVAAMVNNRKRPELADVIGPFANNVALRTNLSGLPTFKQLLSRVKGVVLSALANSELPFSQVLSALSQDQEGLEESSVLQTAFNVELSESASGPIERIAVPRASTQVDLEIFLQTAGSELQGEIIYNADLFEESTAQRIAQHFKVLLETALEAPDEVAADLSMLSMDERAQLLGSFNATDAHVPADKTLSQLFEAQAAAKPQAECLTDGSKKLTYAEVDQKANQLAYHVVASGVSPGATVALLMRRSADFIISLLAVLKAGCAYSALPADLPEPALHLVLQNAAPALVITNAGLHASLPKGPDAPRVFNFDSAPDVEALSKRPARKLAVRASPGEAAFIDYLPGLGNRPQGVEHTHVAVANLILVALHDTLPHSGSPVVLCHADNSTSSALLEIWAALLTGGSLALMTEATNVSIGQVICQAGVTAALLTGDELESILEDGSLEEATKLQTLWLRKEEVDFYETFDSVCAIAPHVKVYIGSGPSEAVPFAIMSTLEGGGMDAELLGKPVANTRAYVLSDRQCPLPIGVPGRLHISGASLARGMLRAPQQTAQRFIANPFFDPFRDPPAFSRMVDTGILATWRPDGSLSFAGFANRQVLLRGSRIMLSDVEAVLEGVPGVEQAVALVQDDPTGAQRLVAYVTPASLDGASVLQQLRGKLPAHLVPASVTALLQFPRILMSSQVDSVSLPTPDWTAPAAQDYVAPSNALEKQIQALFQKVLGKERVSTTANFFAEGGSQEQAAEVMAQMQQVIGRGMPASLLARSPTVVGLAETLAAMPAVDPSAEFAIPRTPFTPAQKAAGVPCSLRQEDMARRFLEDPDRETGANESVPSCLHLRGKLNIGALEDALALVVQRHEVLHARYTLRHGEVLQIIGEPPRPELHKKKAPAGNSALKQALVEEAAHMFDLEHDDTMIHCVLFEVDQADLVDPAVEEHMLLIVVNHVCTDGWSEKVTMTEINAAYNAFAKTGAPPKPCPEFPELQLSYTDFALWQRSRVQPGGGLESQREYWRKQLKDAPHVPHIPMPSDFDREITDDSLGEEIKVSVPADLVKALKGLAIACGTTLFVTVLGAWKLLLSQYSGLKDVIVQTAMAGRVASELEPLIGWFANGAAVRTKLDGDTLTIKQLLDRIRRSVQGAFANSELPTGEQTVMAGLPEEDEPKLMPFGFAVHDESFFRVPEWHGLQAKRVNVVTDESEQEFGGVMLELDLLEDSGQLMGTLGYNVDLFKESTVIRIAQQFQAMLEAFVQSGPAAPIAGLPVMSELLKRMADLDEEEAGLLRSMGTAAPQALAPVAEEEAEEPDLANVQQMTASHALKPSASLSDPFGSLALEEPVHVSGAAHEAEAPEKLVEVDAGTMVQALRTLRSNRPQLAPGLSGLARPGGPGTGTLAGKQSGLVSLASGLTARQSGIASKQSDMKSLRSKRSTVAAH